MFSMSMMFLQSYIHVCSSRKKKQTNKQSNEPTTGIAKTALDYTFFGVDVVKRQKGDFGQAIVGAITNGLGPCAATFVTTPGWVKPRSQSIVGPGQVHHGCGARIHFADGQALEVRPVSGGQGRPRGLFHGQFEVKQIHHVVNVVTRRRFAILYGTMQYGRAVRAQKSAKRVKACPRCD